MGNKMGNKTGKKMTDLRITISGSTGEEAQTMATILMEMVLLHGYAVFAWRKNEPGGKDEALCVNIRISDKPINSPLLQTDIFVELNVAAGHPYCHPLDDKKILISGTRMGADSGARVVSIARTGQNRTTGKIYRNVAAAGAAASILGIDPEIVKNVLAGYFFKMDRRALSAICAAGARGYAMAGDQRKKAPGLRLPRKKDRYFTLTGNDAIAMAAAYAGCRSICSFPMASPTGIITLLERQHTRVKSVARQIEEAIAPVVAAITAGCKPAQPAIAGPSPGSAWMAGGVYPDWMAKTPVVIVLGEHSEFPAGMQSRTLLGDYFYALCTGSAQNPKPALSPENAEDAFYKTVFAFNLADACQMPVIISTDRMLAESVFSIGKFDPIRQTPFAYLTDPEKIEIHTRHCATAWDFSADANSNSNWNIINNI